MDLPEGTCAAEAQAEVHPPHTLVSRLLRDVSKALRWQPWRISNRVSTLRDLDFVTLNVPGFRSTFIELRREARATLKWSSSRIHASTTSMCGVGESNLFHPHIEHMFAYTH